MQRPRLSSSTCIGARAIFWRRGWIDFARKIWGSARKMNPRTNMIKQDETRKLDYIDRGKSLKNLYLHLYLYFSYFSFIIFKMLFFIFWPLPEKLLDCPKKIILLNSKGLRPPAPQLIRLCQPEYTKTCLLLFCSVL